MCTSIALLHGSGYFGRNLDLEYSFGEQVVIMPRLFPLHFHRLPSLTRHFSMIGMANVAEGYPLYAEAVNEKGLYMAGLNFPGNACYEADVPEGFDAAAPYELIPWILGTCETLAQAFPIPRPPRCPSLRCTGIWRIRQALWCWKPRRTVFSFTTIRWAC